MKVGLPRERFLLFYSAATALVFLCLFLIFSQVFSHYFIRSLEEDLLKEANTLGQSYLAAYVYGESSESSFEYECYFINKSLNTRTFILGIDRTILIDSVACHVDEPVAGYIGVDVDDPLIDKAFSGKVAMGATSLDELFSKDVISVALPVFINRQVDRVVVINSPYPMVKKNIDLTNRIIFVALAFVLMLIVVSVYLYSRQTNRTLAVMKKASASIASGNFDTRIEVKDDSVFSELALNMNEMANELGKLEEIRKDFLANISHDFRSPLTSIKGFVQAILDGTIPLEKQDKYLNIVLDEADRLTRLTNDILLLTRMESHAITFEPVTFDVHDVIRKVLLQFEQKMLQKQMDLKVLMGKGEAFVFADINQIQRVIYNLVDNAVKFSHEGGILVVQTDINKGKIEISIQDNGQGISEENMKYIWDRFHKVDRSRGMDKKGVGLGLSIVREIIKAHNEKIDVYSQVGKGSTFVFTLPLSKEGRRKNGN